MRVPDDAPWRDRNAAERMADNWRAAQAKAGGVATIAAHMALNYQQYVAIRLSDGGWDRVLYDTRDEALQHQSGDRNLYAYLPLRPDIFSPRVCDSLLWYWRRVYDGGYRPDGTHEGITIARVPNSIEVVNG